jgi:cysteine-rich repeat protein
MDDTDDCPSNCLLATCGDGYTQAMVEECDDANMDDSDDCVDGCLAAVCGDGFVQAGVEECDDANLVEDDACANDCTANLIPIGNILVGGTAFTNIPTALTALNQPHMTMGTQWLAPNAADILIMANNGGDANGPDYNAFLDAGGHVLMFGGSGLQAYRDYVAGYFGVGASPNWHTADDCMSDWNVGNAHPITTYLPATYEFTNQFNSNHMVHFTDVGQPGNTTILGNTCHQAPDNHTMITRTYQNGGSFTYVAYLLGQDVYAPMGADFIEPFLQGYFEWLQMGAP